MTPKRDKYGRFLKRPTRRKPACPARRQACPARKPSSASLRVVALGRVESIRYWHVQGGRYQHRFAAGVMLYATKGSPARLIIQGPGLGMKTFIND